MALALVSCLVLGPLAVLVVDLLRGGAGHNGAMAPSVLAQQGTGGHRVRAPRPKWPTPAAGTAATRVSSPAPAPAPRFRPTGGRRDHFGDGLLDRTS